MRVAAVELQKEAAINAGEPWPPVADMTSQRRWQNSTSIVSALKPRRRSSAGMLVDVMSTSGDARQGSTASSSAIHVPGVAGGRREEPASRRTSAALDSDVTGPVSHTLNSTALPKQNEALQPAVKAGHRSMSVGVLPRPRHAAVTFANSTPITPISQSTAALGSVGRSIPSVSRHRKVAGTRSRTGDGEIEGQKRIALARSQAAYDSVLRYSTQLVLSETSVLAIIARVLKLRWRSQQAIMSEGQFVLATSVLAAYGLCDLDLANRRLVLRKRLIAAQVSFWRDAGVAMASEVKVIFSDPIFFSVGSGT